MILTDRAGLPAYGKLNEKFRKVAEFLDTHPTLLPDGTYPLDGGDHVNVLTAGTGDGEVLEYHKACCDVFYFASGSGAVTTGKVENVTVPYNEQGDYELFRPGKKQTIDIPEGAILILLPTETHAVYTKGKTATRYIFKLKAE